MKLESLVIVNQPCHGEYVPGSCTHRPSHHGSRKCPKPVTQPGGYQSDKQSSRRRMCALMQGSDDEHSEVLCEEELTQQQSAETSVERSVIAVATARRELSKVEPVTGVKS